MAFFDFLQDQDDATKPKRRKGDIAPPSMLDLESVSPSLEPASPNAISPERSAQLQKRNAAANEVKNKALKVVESALRAKGLKPGQSFVGEENYLDAIYQAQPGQLSQAVRTALRNMGADTRNFEADVRDLENLESQSMRVEEATPKSDIPLSPEKMLDITRKVTKAQNDLKYAVTGEQIQGLKATIDEGLKILNAGKPQEAAPAEAQQATPEDQALKFEQDRAQADSVRKQQALTGDDGTPGRDSIFEPFEAMSPSGGGKDEFVRQVSKVLQKVGFTGDPLSRVAFWAAVPAWSEALGTEAFNRVTSKVANDERAQSAKRYEQTQQKSDERRLQAQDDQKAMAQEKTEILKKLADDDVMNTPLGIAAFIVMSLILGPNMSAFILTRSRNRGILQNQFKDVAARMKQAQERESREFEFGQRASFEALNAQDRFGLQAEEEKGRKTGRQLEHVYRLREMRAEFEAMKKLNGGKSDPVQKELLGAFEMRKAIAHRAAVAVDSIKDEMAQWAQKLSDPALSPIDKKNFRERIFGLGEKMKQAQANLANAELSMAKIEEMWTKRYGTSPAEVQPATEAGGE